MSQYFFGCHKGPVVRPEIVHHSSLGHISNEGLSTRCPYFRKGDHWSVTTVLSNLRMLIAVLWSQSLLGTSSAYAYFTALGAWRIFDWIITPAASSYLYIDVRHVHQLLF